MVAGQSSLGAASRVEVSEAVIALRPKPSAAPRLEVLDGWRAISILLVLACHMLPLGPKPWQLNADAGRLGMALFFTLSGFLITTTLHAHQDVVGFFIRRGTRILPLAFLYAAFAMTIGGTLGWRQWAAHGVFIVNYLPDYFVQELTRHYWSLCVEVHFYILIGVTMAVTRFRAFPLIPLALFAVTVNRMFNDPHSTMLTHFRIDEILSGCCLALIYLGLLGDKPRRFLMKTPAWVFLGCLLLTCHEKLFPADWFRAYFASALIGHTLFLQDTGRYDVLKHRWLKYIAETSYAIYVIHPATSYGWFSEGTKVVKYLKRPICLVMTFTLSHLSTYYWERPWIKAGKRWVTRWEARHSPAEIPARVDRSGVRGKTPPLASRTSRPRS